MCAKTNKILFRFMARNTVTGKDDAITPLEFSLVKSLVSHLKAVTGKG